MLEPWPSRSSAMSVLNPTPDHLLVDGRGRPYFLWDLDMSLRRFEELLREGDRDTRAYLVGKLMRQAKPDDVFRFVAPGEIRRLWPHLERFLGGTRAFWRWLLATWSEAGHG